MKTNTLMILITLMILLLPTLAAAQEGMSAAAHTRPPVEITKAADGDTFLRRDMPDVVERFNLNEADLSSEEALWLEYLERPHPDVATVRKYFREAARTYGVPVSLLMAIGRVENNWTQVGPSVDQGWGIMHLVRNEYADTLGEAARLLQVDVDLLKDDARLNILGAAALLAEYAGPEASDFTRPEDWFEAVKAFTALSTEPLRQLQAETYYRMLREGTRSSTLWDEKIELEPHPEIDLASLAERNRPIPLKTTVDYRHAVAAFTPCNYTVGRTSTLDTWVNHYIGIGTYAGAISWFHNCYADKPVSAHFVIRNSDGEISQVVKVADTAWHAGAVGYPNNARSIGVEHEVTAAAPDLWYHKPLLMAATNIARYFGERDNIDRARKLPGIRGHNEMPGTSTPCPGNLPWGNWMHRLNYGTGGCFCDDGWSYWGKDIPKGDTYCGMVVCGGYGGTPRLFECTSSGWQGLTYYCNCRCTQGLDQYGDPIDPDYTYCGFQVCGTNHQLWECTSSGWNPLYTACGDATVVNWDIEDNDTGQYGAIDQFEPNGGWAYHSQYPAGNNGSLGSIFGFYSAGGNERVGQVLATRFQAYTTYNFKSWAIGGGNRAGRVPYQIGYAATDEDLNSFVPLNTQVIDLTGNQSWIETSGVSYTTGSWGAALGKQIIIRFGGYYEGGSSDIWFDNITVTIR